VRAVIAVARPGPGEGDLLLGAVAQEMVVDELRSVVGVDPDDRKREDRHDVLEGLEAPLRGLVAHAAVDRPPGCDIGDRERETVLARGVASLVADQVDLDEPGHRVVPLRPGSDRDL